MADEETSTTEPPAPPVDLDAAGQRMAATPIEPQEPSFSAMDSMATAATSIDAPSIDTGAVDAGSIDSMMPQRSIAEQPMSEELSPEQPTPEPPTPQESMRRDPTPRRQVPQRAQSSAAPIALPELCGSAPTISGNQHLGLLLDVGIEVAAVVGTRELKLEQLLAIQPGTIIDLDKHAGQPIELYANGKPIALAEIVVIDGRLGARVVESLVPQSS